jgi:hypothetical protein
LGQKFSCRLRADAGHAGNVVGNVAAEPQHVDDLRHPLDAPLLTDFFNAPDLGAVALAGGAIHLDLFCDQLAEVFVRGDHVDFIKTVGLGPAGEGADDVIGLVAVLLQHRQAECLRNPVEVG